MKTILWVQNEDALTPDTFVIDGSVSQYSDTPDQNKAFAALTKASAELRMTPEFRRILSDKYRFTEQANYGISDAGYYIQGCFEERDNRGRNMPYMFLTSECETFKQAVDILKETAAKLNRTCIQDDLRYMTHYFKKIDKLYQWWIIVKPKKKDKTLYITLVAVIVLILLIWIILN